MEIYLIRHGECFKPALEYFSPDKNAMDPPLTSKGTEQAHSLANRISNIYFDKIYSSDLRRAAETAEIINRKINTEVIITRNFREIDMGDLIQKSWQEFPEIYSEWLLHREDIAYPNGENGQDVWNRCKIELESIMLLNYSRIAIVCHGGTIRSLICGFLGIPQQNRFFLGLPLMNCSISIIGQENDQYFLHTFNDHNHIL